MGLKEVNKIFYEKDKKENKIGDGSEGTVVYRGYIKDDFEERKVAVKRLLKEKYDTGYKEIETLRHLESHENIIRYFRSGEEEDFLYIALELCQANLEGLVTGTFNPKSPLDHKEILSQIANGIQYLHRLKIVHRDLKPRNILVKEWDTGLCLIKVSDFGISKKIESGRNVFTQSTSWRGTLGWMAPEIINKKPGEKMEADLAVDLFSAGCIFYYICTGGDHPFGEEQHCHSNIAKGEYRLKDLTSDLKDLIENMIKFDPRLRLPSDQVLAHSYFRSNDKKSFKNELPDDIYQGFGAIGRLESPFKTDDEKVYSIMHHKYLGMSLLLNPDLGELMANKPEAKTLFKENENLQNIIKEIRDNPSMLNLYFSHPDLVQFVNIFTDNNKDVSRSWMQKKTKYFVTDDLKRDSGLDSMFPCHDREKWWSAKSSSSLFNALQSHQPINQQHLSQQSTNQLSNNQQTTNQQPNSQQLTESSQQFTSQQSSSTQTSSQQPTNEQPAIQNIYGGHVYYGQIHDTINNDHPTYQPYQPYQNQTYHPIRPITYNVKKVETLVLGGSGVNIIHHPADEDLSDNSDDGSDCDEGETVVNSA